MSQSSDYRLSEAERDYLRSGKTGSYSESELQNRIKEKQCKIGSRLQALIEDLSLMYQSESYNFGENCDDIFEGLSLRTLERSLGITLIRGDPTKSMKDLDWGEQVTKPKTPEEFGYLLGGFLHILFGMRPLHRYWERALRGLLHFYLMAAGKKLSAQIQVKYLRELWDRYEILKELVEFEQIENMTDDEPHVVYTNDKYTYMTRPDLISIEDRMDTAKDFLDRIGMPSSSFLQYYLSNSYHVDEKALWRQTKSVIFTRLEKLQEHSKFNQTMILLKFIKADESFFEKEWRGPNRFDILKQMTHNNSRVKYSAIATSLGEESSKHLVTNALSKMSNEVDDSERWTCYPVTEKYSDGWKLTPYGRLLAMYANGDIPISEIERYAVPDKNCQNEQSEELISNALDQVDLD